LASKFTDRIRDNFAAKSTEELLRIWEENDRGNFSDEAFEVIHELLLSRHVEISKQKVYRIIRGYEKFDNETVTSFIIKTIHHRGLRKYPNWQMKVKPAALLFINEDNPDEYMIVEKEGLENITIKKSGFIYFTFKSQNYVFEISQNDIPNLQKSILTPKGLPIGGKVRVPFAMVVKNIFEIIGFVMLAGTALHLWQVGFSRLQGPEGTTWYGTLRVLIAYIILAAFAAGVMGIGKLIGRASNRKQSRKQDRVYQEK